MHVTYLLIDRIAMTTDNAIVTSIFLSSWQSLINDEREDAHLYLEDFGMIVIQHDALFTLRPIVFLGGFVSSATYPKII